MYRDYGQEYKVFIEFHKDVMNNEEVKGFVKKNFEETQYYDEVKIVELRGHSLELFWKVPVDEGVHEIEIPLYYVLENDKYGIYTCEYIR